ncbi:MAG: glycosyltransferase family 2 protein [Planctomycetes bacterium]|nr:glycosyltransferase family 2 protein [Planctomycetota bacterium]MBM4078937.1 glycosyltransferase family 2 protein [Planctomycetota bacterium]MBM4084018.1 glycosyltransferase family 2 protein [Planctomycetota bacterium]
MRVSVVIPALNEEKSVGLVVAAIPRGLCGEIVVVNNGSTDATAQVAAVAGARVVDEPCRGYGAACLKGIASLAPTDVVVFLDADYSDHPDEMPRVVTPILDGRADLVIGSRVLGSRERGALLPQAYFGNKLATFLIRLLYGVRFTDLGPFRAIRWDMLQKLRMADRDFGWTVEMQAKAAKMGLRVTEVPVSYRRRVGVSKITGTLRGTALAGWKIIYTILKCRLE